MGKSPVVMSCSTHVTHISSLAGIIHFKIRLDFRLLRNFSEALGSGGHPIRLASGARLPQKCWLCRIGRKQGDPD